MGGRTPDIETLCQPSRVVATTAPATTAARSQLQFSLNNAAPGWEGIEGITKEVHVHRARMMVIVVGVACALPHFVAATDQPISSAKLTLRRSASGKSLFPRAR